MISGSIMKTPLYDWFGLNNSMFHYLNSMHGPVIDQLAMSITRLGHPNLFPFYIALVLMVMWIRPAAMPIRNIVVFAVSYTLISLTLVPLLKVAFNFPRPLTVLGADTVTMLGNPNAIYSFPSGHSAFAVLMAASLLPGQPWWHQAAFVIYAILVCLSRVIVGAHFPADVIAGAAISIILVSCIRYVTGLSGDVKEGTVRHDA